jgi:hypothetical protein
LFDKKTHEALPWYLELVRTPIHEVAVEHVRHRLHVTSSVRRKPVVRKQEQQIPELA